VSEDRLDVYLNDVCVMKQGCPAHFNKEETKLVLSNSQNVLIRLCLHLGDSQATAWGCDLSEEYVRINSTYTT